jgi:23S rRNA (adenine2503-C2)-methyltransferase
VEEFVRILAEYGVPCTPRTRRGIDIDAGCGQLKAELVRRKPKAELDVVTELTLDAIEKEG